MKKEVDSIATALSTVLAFFNFAPSTVWYDNACNCCDYAILRMPFLRMTTFLIVDRFHFKGHSCCNQYNPDLHKTLVNQLSCAAVIMNAVLDKSSSFIRYMKGQKRRQYLRIMFALKFFPSILKDQLNRYELPIVDKTKFFNQRFPCEYSLGYDLADYAVWQRVTVDTVQYEPTNR